jgi:hypothetical protein
MRFSALKVTATSIFALFFYALPPVRQTTDGGVAENSALQRPLPTCNQLKYLAIRHRRHIEGDKFAPARPSSDCCFSFRDSTGNGIHS